MKTLLASGTAILLALTALIAAELSGKPQGTSTPAESRTSQGQVKPAENAAANGGRTIPCKTPENVSSCYRARGRLSYQSVNFTWLLWKIGTHRLLKICDDPTFKAMQSTGDCDDPEYPANLRRIYDSDRRRWKRAGGHGDYYPPDVFGDFEICPLEPERRGVRQYACIESAEISFVQK
jgi:hypothetical protein